MPPPTHTLTLAESSAVASIRALVILDSTPGPAIIDTLNSLAGGYHTAGLPFNPAAILAALYPNHKRSNTHE